MDIIIKSTTITIPLNCEVENVNTTVCPHSSQAIGHIKVEVTFVDKDNTTNVDSQEVAFIVPTNYIFQGIKTTNDNQLLHIEVTLELDDNPYHRLDKDIFCPKDGDFLVYNEKYLFIYKTPKCIDDKRYSAYGGLNFTNNKYFTHPITNYYPKTKCRYATPKEKESFLETIENMFNLTYHSDTHLFSHWVPSFMDRFYFINSHLEVDSTLEHYPGSEKIIKALNCFKTHELCENAIGILKNTTVLS